MTGGGCRAAVTKIFGLVPQPRKPESTFYCSRSSFVAFQVMMTDFGQDDGPNGTQIDSFSRTGVPTNAQSTAAPTSLPFFLDPSLVSPMSAPDLADGARSPYKTNLGLLVDAMETKVQPGGSRSQQPGPGSSASNANASPPTSQSQNQDEVAYRNAALRSLIAASTYISPPAGTHYNTGRTNSQDQSSANLLSDKVMSPHVYHQRG